MNQVKYIEVGLQKIPALFDLNVAAELQEKYGSITEWNDACFPQGKEPRLKPLIDAYTYAINEGYEATGQDERVSEKTVGRILTELTLSKAAKDMQQMVIDSTKSGNEEKNAHSPVTENLQNSTLTG